MYLDLANTYLHVRAKIVNGNGTDIVADTPVAPVNNWILSLFSQVDVYLNDTLVTPSSNTYLFRSYVETLLSYGAEAKKTQLSSQQGHDRAHVGYDRQWWQSRYGSARKIPSGESGGRYGGSVARRPQRCRRQVTFRA